VRKGYQEWRRTGVVGGISHGEQTIRDPGVGRKNGNYPGEWRAGMEEERLRGSWNRKDKFVYEIREKRGQA